MDLHGLYRVTFTFNFTFIIYSKNEFMVLTTFNIYFKNYFRLKHNIKYKALFI
jgi:hypothetical protein